MENAVGEQKFAHLPNAVTFTGRGGFSLDLREFNRHFDGVCFCCLLSYITRPRGTHGQNPACFSLSAFERN